MIIVSPTLRPQLGRLTIASHARIMSHARLSTDDHTVRGLTLLHSFAAQMGLKPEDYQDIKKMPYYQLLTLAQRRQALYLGATPMPSADAYRLLAEWDGVEIGQRFRAETKAINPQLELD